MSSEVRFAPSRVALVLAASLVLSACGGGGGSSSPTPPPTGTAPSPPANSAPVAVVTVTPASTAVDEGQSFTIDATGSTDSDGDTLSFSITQTGGPAATELSALDGLFTFDAPEVSQDETLSFQVTVSDGQTNTPSSTDVDIANILLMPMSNLVGPEISSFSDLGSPRQAAFLSTLLGDQELGLNVVADTVDASAIELVRFRNDRVTGNFDARTGTPLVGTAAGDPAVFTADAFIGTSLSPVVALENQDRVEVLGKAPAMVDSPCSLAPILPRSFVDVVVGTKGNGLRIFDNVGADLSQPPSTRGDLVAGQVLAETGTFCTLSVSSGGDVLAAFEAEASTLRTWDVRNRPAVELAPLTLMFPPGLELVAFDYEANAQGFFVAALVLSDGTHDGEHRLVILYNRFDGSPPTLTEGYLLPRGVPSDVVIFDRDPGDGLPATDIAISMRTAPFMAFIASIGSPMTGSATPEFLEPTFAEIGLGVDGFTFGQQPDFTGMSLVVTRTEMGQVDMFEVLPN